MVEDLDRFAAPDSAGVLEVADQLALLGVDADDRRMRPAEAASLPGQVPELPIALGARRAQALAVGVGIARLTQSARGSVPLGYPSHK